MSELVFNGVTAFARLEEQKWSEPLLAIRPHKNQFTYVVVPPERLLGAAAMPHERFTHWSIELTGEFSRTGDGRQKVVGPMADRDARDMAAAITTRFGLPRTPVEVAPSDIVNLPAHSFVTVVGRYFEGHIESPNFEGIMLAGHHFEQGRSYRVTGFSSPGFPLNAPPMTPRPVGYSGPRVFAVQVELVTERA